MLPVQWEMFKRTARREKMDEIPMALIVDSPWIPGYLGISHLDYFLDPELWFQSNLKIMLSVGAKKGEGLMRRLDVSTDPVLMLGAALQEAAKAAGIGLAIEDGAIFVSL